jgi:hypothetical protein
MDYDRAGGQAPQPRSRQAARVLVTGRRAIRPGGSAGASAAISASRPIAAISASRAVGASWAVSAISPVSRFPIRMAGRCAAGPVRHLGTR